jgi:hypothetical protein
MANVITSKLPSITTPVVNPNGTMANVWHRYFRLFSAETVIIPASAGFIVYTGSAFVSRSVSSANNRLTVTNGNGVSGNTTLTVNEANINHDTLTNTHNLTTDIDHDTLTNYIAAEHIDWTNTTEDFITTGAATVSDLTVGSSAISHVIVFAGEHTTVGGAAAEAITVAGVLATDLVFAELKVEGSTPRTILTRATSTDTITVTFSGDPSSDHEVYYQVLRAV